ncbi:MAG TPA: antibiotic biosynthesis monooxygenase [Stellaceae bacterium]|nr:antibiotic biosynthesis monooxygenase [Stellaceae bacterium]
MFVVIFEVQPKPDRREQYLAIAASLRPALERIDGFIDNERFTSRRTEGRILSLSTWRDEKAVIRWRTVGQHHAAQEKGRTDVFADYHLRVGEVTSDTGLPDGASLPQLRFDATEIGSAACATITEFASIAETRGIEPGGMPGLVDWELFEGITVPGKRLLMAWWRDADAAVGWVPRAARHRRVRIIRDYGMADRREAPQYHPVR